MWSTPFRSQRFAERCTARSCDAAAEVGCPRCRAPLCQSHTCEPYGCCEGCAIDLYFAVSRAGRRKVLSGGAATIVSTLGLYALYAVHLAPPVALGIMVAGIGLGVGTLLWGGTVSPRLVDRAFRRQLRGSRLALAAGPVEGGGPLGP